jgi:hypothetical protein
MGLGRPAESNGRLRRRRALSQQGLAVSGEERGLLWREICSLMLKRRWLSQRLSSSGSDTSDMILDWDSMLSVRGNRKH